MHRNLQNDIPVLDTCHLWIKLLSNLPQEMNTGETNDERRNPLKLKATVTDNNFSSGKKKFIFKKDK